MTTPVEQDQDPKPRWQRDIEEVLEGIEEHPDQELVRGLYTSLTSSLRQAGVPLDHLTDSHPYNFVGIPGDFYIFFEDGAIQISKAPFDQKNPSEVRISASGDVLPATNSSREHAISWLQNLSDDLNRKAANPEYSARNVKYQLAGLYPIVCDYISTQEVNNRGTSINTPNQSTGQWIPLPGLGPVTPSYIYDSARKRSGIVLNQIGKETNLYQRWVLWEDGNASFTSNQKYKDVATIFRRGHVQNDYYINHHLVYQKFQELAEALHTSRIMAT